MRSPFAVRVACIAVIGWLLGLPATAQDSPSQPGEPGPPAATIELVQTVPVDTRLAADGMQHAHNVWVEMIAGARTRIDIGQMYVSNAPDGRATRLDPVLAALRGAASRGVKVRLIVARQMVGNDAATLDRLRAIRNLEVGIIDYSPGIQHAKYWVIDDDTVFIGSQNLDWRALEHIHEFGALIRHDRGMAERLRAIFEVDWALAHGSQLPVRPAALPAIATAGVTLVASPDGRTPTGIPDALRSLLHLIENAKQSLRIRLLDFTRTVRGSRDLWTGLSDQLIAAAKRGVKVQVLVSHWNTRASRLPCLRALAAGGVEVRIITIPGHRDGFIPYARVAHSKYMVVDGGSLWLGTSNWSRGYFRDCRGVELVIQRPPLAAQADAMFGALWGADCTKPFDPEHDYPEPRRSE